jgi:hypothetical protein
MNETVFKVAWPTDAITIEKDRRVTPKEYGYYWVYDKKGKIRELVELSVDSYFFSGETYIKITNNHAPKIKTELKPGWYYVKFPRCKTWVMRYKKPDGKSYLNPDELYCQKDRNDKSIIFDEYYIAYKPVTVGTAIPEWRPW